MDDPEPEDRDAGNVMTCGHCGWQDRGALTLVAASPGEDAGRSAAECPRCHAPVEAGMPSFGEILAARRALDD